MCTFSSSLFRVKNSMTLYAAATNWSPEFALPLPLREKHWSASSLKFTSVRGRYALVWRRRTFTRRRVPIVRRRKERKAAPFVKGRCDVQRGSFPVRRRNTKQATISRWRQSSGRPELQLFQNLQITFTCHRSHTRECGRMA